MILVVEGPGEKARGRLVLVFVYNDWGSVVSRNKITASGTEPRWVPRLCCLVVPSPRANARSQWAGKSEVSHSRGRVQMSQSKARRGKSNNRCRWGGGLYLRIFSPLTPISLRAPLFRAPPRTLTRAASLIPAFYVSLWSCSLHGSSYTGLDSAIFTFKSKPEDEEKWKMLQVCLETMHGFSTPLYHSTEPILCNQKLRENVEGIYQ